VCNVPATDARCLLLWNVVLGATSFEHGGDIPREDWTGVFTHGYGRLEMIVRGKRNVSYRWARTRWFAAVGLRSCGPRSACRTLLGSPRSARLRVGGSPRIASGYPTSDYFPEGGSRAVEPGLWSRAISDFPRWRLSESIARGGRLVADPCLGASRRSSTPCQVRGGLTCHDRREDQPAQPIPATA